MGNHLRSHTWTGCICLERITQPKPPGPPLSTGLTGRRPATPAENLQDHH